MKKSVLAIVMTVAASTVLAVTSCAGPGSSSATWRYRMTVRVSTPEGDKAGSAVREVSVANGGIALPESHPSVRLKGEAVVVDLGKRGVLFALLTGPRLGADYGSDIPAYIFMPHQGWLSKEGIQRMSKLQSGPTEVPVEFYPQMVRFRNLNDPKTVENILDFKNCPAPAPTPTLSICISKDHFEEDFGAGVHLKSVTIEMTKDPVSVSIKNYLPWIPDYFDTMLDGQRDNNITSLFPVANALSSGAFTTFKESK